MRAAPRDGRARRTAGLAPTTARPAASQLHCSEGLSIAPNEHDRMTEVAPDLSWADDRPLRTAAVVYESRFGKTRRLAEALARGIRREGVPTDVLSVAEAEQRPVDGYDLLALGCPSSHLTAPSAMRTFLETLTRMPRLKGHYGFAFETHVRRHPGGAARHIESILSKAGVRLVGRHALGVVEAPGRHHPEPRPGEDSEEFRLGTGTETRFEALGAELVQSIRGERAGGS